MDDDDASWRVGDLAHASGLTVRTLHHYDDVGLLRPERTPAGHRVYRRAHVERLYRISVLRRFGVSLDDIAAALDDPGWTLDGALRGQLAALEDQVLRTERLLHRLTDVTSGTAQPPRVERGAEEEAGATPDDGAVAGRPDERADGGPQPEDERADRGPEREGDADAGSAQPGSHRSSDVDVCRRLLAVLEDTAVVATEPLRRIAVLVYADLGAAHRHLVDVFGLTPGPLHRDDDGTVVHAEVRTADGLVMLHRVAPEWRLASPATLGAATGMLVVTVRDVDAHHAAVVARGGTVTYLPTDQPYGVREYGALGPEGEPWSFWSPLPDAPGG